jgi:hypothetical protein
VANLYRYFDPIHHRTRFNNFFLRARWDPEAALCQIAQELLGSLRPRAGETFYVIIDGAKKEKCGRSMEAVTIVKGPTTEVYIHGHQYVGAILVFRDGVIPYGIRLSVKLADTRTVGLPSYTRPLRGQPSPNSLPMQRMAMVAYTMQDAAARVNLCLQDFPKGEVFPLMRPCSSWPIDLAGTRVKGRQEITRPRAPILMRVPVGICCGWAGRVGARRGRGGGAVVSATNSTLSSSASGRL